MTNGAKQFLFWWFSAYIGFIGVRIFEGLPVDTPALIGGLVLQFFLVTVVGGMFSAAKWLVLKLR